MYNESEKKKFLSTITNPANYKIFFNSFGSYEQELGKDIGLMTRKEIAYGLSTMDYILYAVVENFISMSKQYLLWYADEHPNTVSLEVMKLNWMDVDLSENIRNKLIVDETEILDEFPDYPASDGHFVSVVYMLAYFGMTLKDMCKLKNDDVICRKDSVVIMRGESATVYHSKRMSELIRDYQDWERTKVDTASTTYYMVRERTDMFLYRRLRDDDYKSYKPLVGDQITARLYSIKNRVHGGHEYKFNLGEVKVSGYYKRMCEYYNAHGDWPDRKTMGEILGKKCRDEFDRGRMIRGAELYKNIFNL